MASDMPANAAATVAEITAILGPVDETLIVAIQRTDATAAEVLEAFTRAEADDAVGPVARRPASLRVVAVMGLLDAAQLEHDRD